jgi:hypothetical protein
MQLKLTDVMYEFNHINLSLGNPNECLGITLLNTISSNSLAIIEINIVYYSHVSHMMYYANKTPEHISSHTGTCSIILSPICPHMNKQQGWKKLYNEEFHNLYSSPNIARVIKLRRMRWTGQVAHTGAGRNHLGNSDTEGRKILKWILKKWDGRV